MADIVETIQNQNHEKELSLTFALFLLLLFIVILCSKGDKKLVQKISTKSVCSCKNYRLLSALCSYKTVNICRYIYT